MKNPALFIAMILLSFLTQSVNSQDNEIFQSKILVKKWETTSTFKVPESVCFDPVSNVLFVSNINGKPTEKDGLMPAVRLGDNEAHENNGRGTQRPAR